MIAHLAKAVHHGDESSLRKMGLTPDRIRYFKQYRHKKLVVLVESSEQGKALQRYLKCPLFSTDSETTDSTTKVIQIATLTFAFQHSMYATVILNAIGDMEPPAISPKRMWNTHDNTLPRLMIELWDDFNEKVEKHSQSRLKIYQRELRAVWWP